MSNTTDFTVNPTVFEYARTEARSRAAKQWSDERYWNLWSDWNNKTFNPDWFDPWYEYETHGIFNGPSTGDGDPAYEMTQNLYFAYCWFKSKGYHNYSIMAMMSSAIQESTITGALWEGGPVGDGFASHHPYSSLATFDPTYDDMPSPDILGHHYPKWYSGGTYPQYANGSEITYRTQFRDARGYMWYLDLTGWDAVKRYPLALAQYDIVGYPDRMTLPTGSVVLVDPPYYRIDETANGNPNRLSLNTTSPEYTGNGTGYGFCQWTPWTKLPRTCKAGYLSYNQESFNEANRHWQMNGTLQLMIWELERYINTYDPTGHHNQGEYLGQWINSRVASQSMDGAYFIWPYIPDHIEDYTWNWHYYGSNCSWNQFANGDYLAATETLIQGLAQYPDMSDEDKDWCRRQMALAIYRSAFLQATYKDFNFQQRTKYILECIKYWDAHPLPGMSTGWDIHDIPRPRDLPYCELDQYHMTVQKLILLMQRRNQNVRTILL